MERSNRTSIRFLVFALWAFAVVPRVGAQAPDVVIRILPDQGVAFQQIDFTFPQATVADTDWMLIRADPVTLHQETGIRRGFINIDCDAGWIVRNLMVDIMDQYEISTFSRAGIEVNFDVRLFSADVWFSRRPLFILPNRQRAVFPVTPIPFNARGASETEPVSIPKQHVAEVRFDPDAENFSIVLPNLSNVQAADNQCFPASIANSLQYLEDRYGISVPHDNKPGERGDDSLAGQLGEKAGREVTSRRSGEGTGTTSMLAGMGLYLQEAGLSDSLVHSHQGAIDGEDISVPGLTSTDEGEQLEFNWLCEQIARGNDVELVYDFEDDEGEAKGAHAVRVVGCGRQNGVPWIRYAHDIYQADVRGGDTIGTIVQRSFLGDIDDDGRLNLEAFNVELRYAISQGVTDDIRAAATAPPAASAAGVTNAASFSPSALSPGSISTVFGSFPSLRVDSGQIIEEGPTQEGGLPTELAGATVTIDGFSAPLFFAGRGQINFQIPNEVEPGVVSMAVTVDGISSAIFGVEIQPAVPGLFQLPPNIAGPGRAVVQNQDVSVNLPDNPAAPGEVIVVYLTGLGELDNPVATGELASANPLSRALAPAAATIGGEAAEILYLGLTPGFAGLGQANLRVPDLPAGDHPIEIRLGDATSNQAIFAVSP